MKAWGKRFIEAVVFLSRSYTSIAENWKKYTMSLKTTLYTSVCCLCSYRVLAEATIRCRTWSARHVTIRPGTRASGRSATSPIHRPPTPPTSTPTPTHKHLQLPSRNPSTASMRKVLYKLNDQFIAIILVVLFRIYNCRTTFTPLKRRICADSLVIGNRCNPIIVQFAKFCTFHAVFGLKFLLWFHL